MTPLIYLINDTDVYARVNAANALAVLRDPKALNPLIGALNDTDPDVIEAAANALGYINDPVAVEPLIRID